MTQVFIAAPTPMLRAGLRAMLESDDIRVVGEAAAISNLEDPLAGVDVLLLGDDSLLDGAVGELPGEGEIALLVLSDGDAVANTLRSLPVRAWGIVPPDAPAAELRAAVASVAQGLVVLAPSVAERLLGSSPALQALNTGQMEEPLTPRELEVLQLLSQGLPNKLIARELQISEHTVKFHISAIYTKLGASSRTDAVSRGARLGLISF